MDTKEIQNTNSVDVLDDVLRYSRDSVSPDDYFKAVKEARVYVSDRDLLSVYDNCITLLRKYKITGQESAMRKILFHLSCIDKEFELVKIGINSFVYREDIEFFIDNVKDKVVKIINIENYEREIPYEIVDVIRDVKGIFDKLYIVFTDYTGKEERKVEKERRNADPILFGVFQSEKARCVVDRFYYLGDWEDKYCDLTLSSMVGQLSGLGKDNVEKKISTPLSIEQLREQLDTLISEEDKKTFEDNAPYFIIQNNTEVEGNKPSSGLFSKIKTFLSR